MGEHRLDPSLVTGDPLVDEQHRAIHQLLDDILTADDRPDELMRVLERLMDHVDCHFLTEEDLMRRSGYDVALAEPHIADHRRFADTARTAVLDFRAGTLTSMQPLVDLLRDWLASDVDEYDRALIDFVRAQAISADTPTDQACAQPH